MGKSSSKFVLILATAVFLALFFAEPISGHANTITYWDVASGDWQVAGNWTAGVPDSTTDAVIDNFGQVEIGLYETVEARDLTVGDESSGSVPSGTVLPYVSDIRVKGNLTLGKQAGSYGVWGGFDNDFTLTVGQPSAPGNMIVGGGGTGDFELSGSDLTVHGDLIVGDQAGSSGSLFNYYGATASIAGDFILGKESGSHGHFFVRQMNYTVGGDMIVGAGGTGEVDNDYYVEVFETMTVNGNLIVGDQAGSSGNYSSYTGIGNVKGDFILGKEMGSFGQCDWGLIGGGSFTVGQAGSKASNLIVGAGGKGELIMGGDLTVHGNLVVGDQAGGEGLFTQDFGQTLVKGDLILGNVLRSSGEYRFWGNSLTVGEESAPATMIVGGDDRGLFTQHGGTVTVHDRLVLGRDANGHGTYALYPSTSSGAPKAKLSAAEIVVGGEGRGDFEIKGAATEVNVSRSLTFSQDAHLSAVPGATINMTGADFENRSTDPSNLSGLGNLKLVFTGGTDKEDHFEVAGRDMGPVMSGFTNNFALGSLQLGDDSQTGYVGLYDVFDNSSGDAGDEALYVFALILGYESMLDLHNLHLYARSFTNYGGTILSGNIQVVPLPPSVLLLGSGLLGLGAWARRRKRRGT